MTYLLDTNICIYLIKQKPSSVKTRLLAVPAGEIGISTITVSELQYGVAKSSSPEKNQQALNRFLLTLEILEYGEDAAREYGPIRQYLERAGIVIGPLDMLIAAHAKALRLTLVTNNAREFSRVPGLLVENWVDVSGGGQ